MATKLILNISHPFGSPSEIRKGAQFYANAAQALFRKAGAELEAKASTLFGMLGKIEMPEQVQTLVGRAESSFSGILSHVQSGIEKVEAATGISEKFNAALEKTKHLFEKAVHGAEEIEAPVELVKTGFEFGTFVHKIEHLSHKIVGGVTAIAEPLQLLALAAEVQKVKDKVFKAMEHGFEEIKSFETAVLGFSVISKVCNILSWIQQLGIFSHAKHAAVHGGRLSTIGSFTYLMATIFELGKEAIAHTSPLKIGKAFLNSMVALLGAVLIFYISVKLHILLLILTVGSLSLNLATKEKEPEHHRYISKDHDSPELHTSSQDSKTEFELVEIQTA